MPTGLRYRWWRRVGRGVNALVAVACIGCLTLVMGCASHGSTGGPGSAVTVKDDANGTMVHVHVGTEVELVLSSSYWIVDGSSAAAVLRQDGGSTVLPRPSDCPPIPGLGCQPVQTDFTAVAVGTAIVTARRTVCGEARSCPPDSQHFLVTVVVQQ